MSQLAVIILTKNESVHIKRCVSSVRALTNDIFVVDSFSDDGTQELARSAGATVVQREFRNYSDQFQWAIENCPFRAEWLMRLDADEVLGPSLVENLSNALSSPNGAVGFMFNRKHIFWGSWIRFGSRYPLWMVRVWKSGKGRIEQRWMDEHILVDGSILKVQGDFYDWNLKGISFFTAKHNSYAVREAVDILNAKYALFPADSSDDLVSVGGVRLTRLIKERLYNRLPFFVSATMYFAWRYLFRLGFLDGAPGFVYHFLQGWWYRLLVGAKVHELEVEIDFRADPDRLVKLRALTGLALPDSARESC